MTRFKIVTTALVFCCSACGYVSASPEVSVLPTVEDLGNVTVEFVEPPYTHTPLHSGPLHSQQLKTSFLRKISEVDGDKVDDDGKPWGSVIVCALLVNLVTFSGVVLLTFPAIRKGLKEKYETPGEHSSTEDSEKIDGDVVEAELDAVKSPLQTKLLDICVPGFAAGALIATVLFLIQPESMSILHNAMPEEDHPESETDGADDRDGHAFEFAIGATWRFGAALMGGYLLPISFSIFFPKEIGANIRSTSLFLSIIVGDFFHNFVDGIFIATGFLFCDKTTAIAIVLATVYHEIAQEVSDFFLLTNFCGLTILQALAFNFASGLSVLLGGIVLLSTDLSDISLGVILAISAGIYLYISTTECIPRANAAIRDDVKDHLLLLLSFAVGAVPIGLVLLNHKHCEAGH